jgi:hypothetical protein
VAGEISIPTGDFAAYDVLKGERVPLKRSGDRLSFAARMDRLGGMLVALYPHSIAKLRVTIAPRIKQGVSTAFDVSVIGNDGNPLPGTQPLFVKVLAPSGLWPELSGAHATENGYWKANLSPASNDPIGQWRIEVQELSSRTTAQASFLVERR